MTAVKSPPRPMPGRPPRSFGDKVRFVLRGVGQTLITLGLVVLLFVVYEVWITNLFADRNNRHNIAVLQKEWQDGVDPLLPLPGATSDAIPVGKAIGILYIPRFGLDYHEAIVQGNAIPDDSQLEQGAAHYGGTQLPGQIGNFAVAGHRVGKGEPFLNIDKLRAGDAVIVETKSWWYVYKVKGHPAGSDPQNSRDPDGLPGREVVDPSDGNVLLPYPDHPGAKPYEALMTMTTCHPKFTASHRMIVYSVLVTKVPNTALTMPAAIKALYAEVQA